MKKSSLLPLCFLLFFTHVICAQEDWHRITFTEPVTNSDTLIKQGIVQHDEKNYDQAIQLFLKINENDSNYVLAQYELANSYLAAKKDSMVIAICTQSKNLDVTYKSKFLILEANAYDNLKDFKTSEALYQRGIKEYPNSPRFYHELGVSYFKQKKYREAQESFINAIKINPNYSPSHFQLGLFALRQKKIIPAMLALQFYLLLDNGSNRAKSVINFLEQIGDDNINYDEFETFSPFDENDDFSDLESIVKSKAALSSKFKSKVDLNFRVLKQIQVVLDKIEFNAGDKGFYNQFYGKFFKELSSKNHTETYLYYIVSDMNVEAAQKWTEKNEKKISEFGAWFREYMKNNYHKTEIEVNGVKTTAYRNYRYNELNGIGNIDAKGNAVGPWRFYFSNTGGVKSEGTYDSNGNRDGVWKYYHPNGNLKELCTFKNDKLNGEYHKYYENGRVAEHLFYQDGKFNGKQTVYYANGLLKNEYGYNNGVFEGQETGYYETGKLSYKVPVVAGKFQGTYLKYYENGNPEKTIEFNKGMKTGSYKEFFRYPKEAVSNEGMFENDYASGEWKSYYKNGKIYQTGAYKKGLKDGVWKTYDRNGVLLEEENYSNGKSEGISKNLYENGKVYEEFYYRKNKINQYKYYNESGELIKSINKEKNEFEFELYNRNGNKRMTGKINGEQLDGVLTSFNYLGIKTESAEYKDDKKVNSEKEFYSNGQLLSETPYVDGEKHGLYKKYSVTGSELTKGYFVKGSAEGYWFYYNFSGKLTEIRYYDNNEQSGWQRTFACDGKLYKAEYMADGRIVQRCNYDTLNNVIKRINYDSTIAQSFTIPNFDGNIWLKRNVKNNFIDGLSINYYPNGSISTERLNDLDKEIGIVKHYDVYGKISREETYDMGLRNGKYTTYENGKPDYVANYVNDARDGETIEYFENGKPSIITNYVQGNADGDQTFYDENGNLAVILKYKNDNLVGYTYENESGQLVPVIPVNKPDMEIKAYYKNKKPSLSFSIKNGDREGLYLFYSSAGIKQVEVNYSNGYLHGDRMLYFPDGKLQSKTTFYYGDFNGPYTEYYSNGNKKLQANYLNDSRHGLATYYDNTGKVTHKYYFYDDSAMKLVK